MAKNLAAALLCRGLRARPLAMGVQLYRRGSRCLQQQGACRRPLLVGLAVSVEMRKWAIGGAVIAAICSFVRPSCSTSTIWPPPPARTRVPVLLH